LSHLRRWYSRHAGGSPEDDNKIVSEQGSASGKAQVKNKELALSLADGPSGIQIGMVSNLLRQIAEPGAYLVDVSGVGFGR
jgi:hypothetical protein